MTDVSALSVRRGWKGVLFNIWLRSLQALFVPNREEDIRGRTKALFPHELIGAIRSHYTVTHTSLELASLLAKSWRLWDETDMSADEWPCAVHLSRMTEDAHGDVWSSSAAGSEVRPYCEPPACTAPT